MNNYAYPLFKSLAFFFFQIAILNAQNDYQIPVVFQEQEASAIADLRKRMGELKEESADKQMKIGELELTVLDLSSRTYRLEREKADLRRTIRTKTEEIFKLRGELTDVLVEYGRILLTLEQYKVKNSELKQIIEEINQEKEKLTQDLTQANEQIQFLRDTLTKTNFANEALAAEIENLESELNEILDNVKYINLVELSLNLFNGARFSYQTGVLLKKSDLYFGAKVGYQFLKDKENTILLTEIGLLPISLQLASVIKNQMGFEYVGINEKIINNYKLFLFADAGWSLGLHSASASLYSRGGLNAAFGTGVILNLNEGVNAFGKVSLNIQNVRNPETNGTKTFFYAGIVYGLMF